MALKADPQPSADPDPNRPSTSAAASTGAICVFARLPVPGRVKTRLAAGVGPESACDFYRACLDHTLHQAARCGR